MRLRTTFLLSLLAVLLVMAIPALLGVRHVKQVRAIALDLRTRSAEGAFAVGRIQADLERLERHQRAYVATGDVDLADRTRTTIRTLRDDLDLLRQAGYGSAVETASLPIEAIEASTTLTILLMRDGNREEATSVLRLHLVPLLTEAAASAASLASAVDEVTASRLARADRITGRAVTTTNASLIVALLVAAVLVILATRVLTRPLQQLSDSMAAVADGDFDPPQDLPYDRQDEVGALFRAFRSMALQLADLDRMKAEFVSVASHDLKTPVNVISGYTELLADELGPEADERQRRILDTLGRQTRTLSTRLDHLLEISRIEAAGLRLGLEEINLRHFTSELARTYSARAARHRIEVVSAIDESAPTFLIADPDTLRNEVFDNLLENAIKFTPRGGSVRLVVAGHGGTVTFDVADEGPPIPPEALPHVFDKYYRGRDPSGRVGAGLRLPIARAGVEAHGGTIEAMSPAGTGALFRITLPIHPTIPTEFPGEDPIPG